MFWFVMEACKGRAALFAQAGAAELQGTVNFSCWYIVLDYLHSFNHHHSNYACMQGQHSKLLSHSSHDSSFLVPTGYSCLLIKTILGYHNIIFTYYWRCMQSCTLSWNF
jgi:hypothetical protein